MAFSSKLLCQEFSIQEYQKALELIRSDSTLSKKYCGSDSLLLTVHSSFEYFPISIVEDFLNEQHLSEVDIKRLKKLDLKQKANQNHLSYKSMLDEFYSSLNLDSSPCAIVCFDRLKEFVIVAQVTTYRTGLDWERIVLNRNIDVFLFDIRKTPFAYKRVTLNR